MPLEINPKPDTVIRVMMQFIGVNNYKEIDEQKLDNGFRIINNCGSDGGQEVMHLHFHLLGGKKLSLNA